MVILFAVSYGIAKRASFAISKYKTPTTLSLQLSFIVDRHSVLYFLAYGANLRPSLSDIRALAIAIFVALSSESVSHTKRALRFPLLLNGGASMDGLVEIGGTHESYERQPFAELHRH